MLEYKFQPILALVVQNFLILALAHGSFSDIHFAKLFKTYDAPYHH